MYVTLELEERKTFLVRPIYHSSSWLALWQDMLQGDHFSATGTSIWERFSRFCAFLLQSPERCAGGLLCPAAAWGAASGTCTE